MAVSILTKSYLPNNNSKKLSGKVRKCYSICMNEMKFYQRHSTKYVVMVVINCFHFSIKSYYESESADKRWHTREESKTGH